MKKIMLKDGPLDGQIWELDERAPQYNFIIRRDDYSPTTTINSQKKIMLYEELVYVKSYSNPHVYRYIGISYG